MEKQDLTKTAELLRESAKDLEILKEEKKVLHRQKCASAAIALIGLQQLELKLSSRR